MKRIVIWILVLMGSIGAILNLTKSGFYGASDEMHIAWIQQMDKAMGEGQVPPRYVPDLSYGFGYPLFNFISPLPYYVGVGIHKLGFSYVDSFKIVLGLSIIGSALAMYALGAYLGGTKIGLAASLIYTYSPYRATDIYVRGALGESVAFVWLPLITLAILKIGNNDSKWRWVGVGGLAIGALVLSHNIVSFMFLPMVAGLIILGRSKERLQQLVAVGLGGLVSVYFWLAALVDSNLMKYDPVYWFYDHFPSLKQLLVPYWGYGGSVPGNYDTMSFFIGEINIVLIILGLYLGFKSKMIWWVWVVGIIGVSTLMMNYRSFWVWQNLPMLDYFQFPWRFLTMVTFGTALLVATLAGNRKREWLAIMLGMSALILNFSRFKPQDHFPQRGDSYFLGRYIPRPIPSEDYENIAEEYLRLPKANEMRPERLYPPFWVEGTSEIIKMEMINSLEAKAIIEVKGADKLNFSKYNFGGWRAYINGEEVEPLSGKPFGQVRVDLANGTNQVWIKFEETDRNKLLNTISLLAGVGSLGLVLKGRKK